MSTFIALCQENYWAIAGCVGAFGLVVLVVMLFTYAMATYDEDRLLCARAAWVGLMFVALCWAWPVLAVLTALGLVWGLVALSIWLTGKAFEVW